MNKTRKTVLLAVIIATAMILSFLESKIPVFTAIPGIKIGLANIAVLFTLYKLGTLEAICVSLVRAVLLSLLFGSIVSLTYSLFGAILSFAVMILIRKLTPASEIGVSVAGGVCHNIGQIIAACFIMETNIIAYYLPFLLLSGVIAGIAVGIASSQLIKRIKIR